MRKYNFDGLSLGQRAYIRKQYRAGSTMGSLAEKYGVKVDSIYDVIVSGRVTFR